MAKYLQWIPDSLYNYSVSSVVNNYSYFEKDLKTFPSGVVFDVYYKLYKVDMLPQLLKEFQNLEQFEKVLKVSDKRYLLHNSFQALMDNGYPIAMDLAVRYQKECRSKNPRLLDKDNVIKFGFALATFLTDAGWFPESEIVLHDCLVLCSEKNPPDQLPMTLECYKRLLHVQNCYCKIKDAAEIWKKVDYRMEEIKLHQLLYKNIKVNYAGIYSEMSAYYFIQSNYKEAYNWSVKAIAELDSSLSCREIVSILCIASKACVVKKQFKQAELLIKQAVQRASEKFGNRNLVVADTLIDYGHFLLHNDSASHAVRVYQRALDIRINVLGGRNLLVAIAHEDLAYASYVAEYSTGHFSDARDHVEKALSIKNDLLPEEHFLLPSAKRVNALILEEIAIDSHDKDVQRRLFLEAEEFHMSALQITQNCLGELTVQTGKHYGNLGRLYQSMKKFNKARKMHQRAIAIKQQILGPNDYEVAISYGHLASLFNYDLGMFKEAEQLYLKAIAIGLRQFGRGYSGLEYDYRGLLRVYSQLGEASKVAQLHSDLHDWKIIRDQTIDAASKTSPLSFETEAIEPENLYNFFLTMHNVIKWDP